MTSLRAHEGYMMVDNRQSQGIDDATMVALGYPVGAGRGLFEASTYTCSHCNAVVVIEQKRTRERGYCRGCSRQICDGCNVIKAQTFECRSMARIIDETLESAVRQTEAGPTILLP
jgi:hypothetical protein